MLTLTETKDRINAIDTDNDVIIAACKALLPENLKSKLDKESSDERIIFLSGLITDMYIELSTKPLEILSSLSYCIATVAAVSVSPSAESKGLLDILTSITEIYLESLIYYKG
jgi:hypothetical protein